MSKLELYLDKYNNGEIDNGIYKRYSEFDYLNEDLYKLHLDFMLKNLYNIRIVENKRKRLGQTEYRTEMFKKFNNKCIITGETCKEELEASHIVPVHCNENYDIDNGLLLMRTLHSTFDAYKWSINPDTLTIETKKNQNVGTIKKYENKKVNLVINEKLYNNLMNHYTTFLQK